MKTIRTTSGGSGEKGEAKVAIGNGKVQITFKASGESYLFDKNDVPSYVRKGTWFVQLSGNGERIYGFRPLTTIATAKFVKMIAREGEIPAPIAKEEQKRTARDGRKYTDPAHLDFSILLELTDPEVAGMQVPVYFRYLFADDGAGGTSLKGGGRYLDQLESFLDVAGVLDTEIKFSDNVLPKLQSAILKANKSFKVMIKDGWVDSFMEGPDVANDDDEDEIGPLDEDDVIEEKNPNPFDDDDEEDGD